MDRYCALAVFIIISVLGLIILIGYTYSNQGMCSGGIPPLMNTIVYERQCPDEQRTWWDAYTGTIRSCSECPAHAMCPQCYAC